MPISNLMEDAATAEISRSQIWQWLSNSAVARTGQMVTPTFLRKVTDEEILRISEEIGHARFDRGRFKDAGAILDQAATSRISGSS